MKSVMIIGKLFPDESDVIVLHESEIKLPISQYREVFTVIPNCIKDASLVDKGYGWKDI
jgi:hypothetical protein